MTGRARMAGFLECLPDDRRRWRLPSLHCPAGHRIPWDQTFLEMGYPRCRARASSGRSLCDARLVVQFMPRVVPSALPLLYVAEVTPAELEFIAEHLLDVPGIMAYLGLGWAPERAG